MLISGAPISGASISGAPGDFVPAIVIVGPVTAGLDTVLTNKKPGTPGKYFTRKQKGDLLFGIYQEGVQAKQSLDNSELAIAERKLAKAKKIYQDAEKNRILTGYSMVLSEDLERAYGPLQEAQNKVDSLKKAESKRRAVDEAKKHWRELVNKARGH